MTLTPEQFLTIYKGVPEALPSGARLYKYRSQQYVNKPKYPLLILTIASEGIPVGEVGLMSRNTATATEVWGQNCRARICAIIEALDMNECRALASELYTALHSSEVGLNPYMNGMQFRGADPPENLPPIRDEWMKKLVQRFAVYFFVEYKFTWQRTFDTIQKVVLGIGKEPETSVFDWETVKTKHSASYQVDVIIE
jgi:hypothetical protein